MRLPNFMYGYERPVDDLEDSDPPPLSEEEARRRRREILIESAQGEEDLEDED